MSAVTLLWKCKIPGNANMKKACESLLTQLAREHGMDTAIVRKEPHNTTRVGRQYVNTERHITGYIINNKAQTGYAVHIYVDNKDRVLLDQKDKPNTEMWELKHKQDKGFVLIGEDGTETVHDI
ncbi:hypothetical protein A7U60_g7158 [Sanghuangporus baumii]|uniref:Uncharacterized protein n=1 Tax=Sanghuangporus baumii TaxID=108892 RepID=A0A9Q5HTS9_SANBA|nr:hypothetical protein A7U60_g7158 [Sanghuangporus baumii]